MQCSLALVVGCFPPEVRGRGSKKLPISVIMIAMEIVEVSIKSTLAIIITSGVMSKMTLGRAFLWVGGVGVSKRGRCLSILCPHHHNNIHVSTATSLSSSSSSPSSSTAFFSEMEFSGLVVAWVEQRLPALRGQKSFSPFITTISIITTSRPPSSSSYPPPQK